MRQTIENALDEFIAEYCAEKALTPLWRSPVVRYGDARHPAFAIFRDIVSADHHFPEDFLAEPTIVVSYFLPFLDSVAASNVQGEPTSREWAEAYLITNAMAVEINNRLAGAVQSLGHRAAVPFNAGFDPGTLTSRWSQRHVAWVCGHGTFGLNNMLIGEKGCCGRYFSIVTNLPINPDRIVTDELCLHKRTGTCKVCVRRCPGGALTETAFDRQRCYGVCRKNEEQYHGAEVCGKCVVGLPCSFRRP